MPNWCRNEIAFRAPPKTLAAFRQLMGAERGAFDFEALAPMPPELSRCNMADESAYHVKYGEWNQEPFFGSRNWPHREAALQAARHPENAERWFFHEEPDPSKPDTMRPVPRTFDEAADMAHANVLNHGHVYWRGWCGEHWGTKWNVTEGAAWESHPGVERVSFETAWSPPLPVLELLAQRFPDAEIEGEYNEPGMGFSGRFSLSGGALQEHDHFQHPEAAE